MNKYYAALLLFIGALTTSPIAAETPENIEIGQDAFTPKKKKLTKNQKIGIGAGVGTAVVVLVLCGISWKTGKPEFIWEKVKKNKETSGISDSEITKV